MQKNNICKAPFFACEVEENGDVRTCCGSHINNYIIGNIYESDFEDIWNSEKAIKLKKINISFLNLEK